MVPETERGPESARSIAEVRKELPHMADEEQADLMEESVDILEDTSDVEMPTSNANPGTGETTRPVDRMQVLDKAAIATARRIAKRKRAQDMNKRAKEADEVAAERALEAGEVHPRNLDALAGPDLRLTKNRTSSFLSKVQRTTSVIKQWCVVLLK